MKLIPESESVLNSPVKIRFQNETLEVKKKTISFLGSKQISCLFVI